jgi:rod shape-determining protein MreC
MTERRIAWLLLVLLLGQLALLTAQGRTGGGSFLERAVVRLVAPLARSMGGLGGALRGVGSRFQSYEQLVIERRRLEREVEVLRLQLLELRNAQRQLDKLRAALSYQERGGFELRVADVAFVDPTVPTEALLLFVGDDPVERSQPVVALDGLVGRVVLATGGYAKVQLITDRSATVGVMIERTRRQGLARGNGQRGLTLDYVPLQSDVRPGDRILTSGIDGVYPPGLPVGEVTTVEPGEELFHHILVEPVVDWDRLDQVYILRRSTLPAALLEEPGLGRP